MVLDPPHLQVVFPQLDYCLSELDLIVPRWERMCGRFALSLSQEDVQVKLNEVQIQVDQWLHPHFYRPNFNLAPRDRAAVVRRLDPQDGRLVVDCMKWGLVPHWAESPPTQGNLLNTINARDDKVLEPRGLWNSIKPKRRCIIICEGFFEWQKIGKEKIPHFIKRADGQLMCLAGLWDSVTYKGDTEALHTFTIITTCSNKYLSFLHDRMPVILPDRASIETWLDTSSSEWSASLGKLLKPFEESDGLVCYPVPKEVGKVGNQSQDFLKPVSERKGNIMSFFNKQAPSQSRPPPTASCLSTSLTTPEPTTEPDTKPKQDSLRLSDDPIQPLVSRETEAKADEAKDDQGVNSIAGKKRNSEALSVDSQTILGDQKIRPSSSPKKPKHL